MSNHTISTALIVGRKLLAQAQVENSQLDARLLLERATSLTYEQIISYPHKHLEEAQAIEFMQLISRRACREPMSHILGQREFYGLTFSVTNATLDPRPDSETLIEAVLEQFPDSSAPLSILDLGTGTGCLLLTLLHLYPNSTGTGADISPAALEVAFTNAQNLNLTSRAFFQLSNWGTTIRGTFDLIISNPPYIKNDELYSLAPEVADYEPHLALFGGLDGLDCYRHIAQELPSLLKNQGIVVLEFGQGQEQQVSDILKSSGIDTISYKQDLGKITRCLVGHKNTNSPNI